MKTINHILVVAIMLLLFALLSYDCQAQNQVAYCKHGQTGEVIVIEANYACPTGYYRI